MDSEYDPEREAMAAIEFAAATHGADRQRWIGIARAWLELARPPAPSRHQYAERSGDSGGASEAGSREIVRSFWMCAHSERKNLARVKAVWNFLKDVVAREHKLLLSCTRPG